MLYHTDRTGNKNGYWHAGEDDFENNSQNRIESKRIRTSQDSYQKEK